MLLNFMIVLDCLANWLEGIEQRLLIELEDWSSQQSVQVVGVKLEEDTNLSLIFYDFFHVKDAGMPDAFERFQQSVGILIGRLIELPIYILRPIGEFLDDQFVVEDPYDPIVTAPFSQHPIIVLLIVLLFIYSTFKEPSCFMAHCTHQIHWRPFAPSLPSICTLLLQYLDSHSIFINNYNIWMLPSIKNPGQPLKMYQFRASQQMAPPSSHSQSRMPHKFSVTHSSEPRNKQSLLFKKSSSFKVRQEQQNNFMATAAAVSNPIRYQIPPTAMYRSNLSDEIRQIERKIRRCQRKIKEERLKEVEERETVDSGKDIEFVDMNRFDFLTNPGGARIDEPVEEVKQVEEPQRKFSEKQHGDFINQNIEKLGIHYAKDLKRKFERRQLMPHKAVKRKVPKLYITQQTNALQKVGKPLSQQQHLFRVMTREVTPQQIYPTIPSFPVVRDNISKNVLAYLADYKPFIDKTKEALPIANKDEEESELNVSGKRDEVEPS